MHPSSVLFAILLAWTAATVFARQISYKDCGEGLSKINEIQMEPCVGFPCHIEDEQSVTIKFTPYKPYVTDLRISVTIIVHDTRRLDLKMEHDACLGHGMICPLEGGKPATVGINLDIPKWFVYDYPVGTIFKIKAELSYGSKNKLVCVIFEIIL